VGVKFKPSMPLITSYKGDSSYLKTNLFSHLISTLLWDMKDMYGASKGPYQYLKVSHMM
jgi:hypothetical protein